MSWTYYVPAVPIIAVYELGMKLAAMEARRLKADEKREARKARKGGRP